ncbi:hypothetical protein B0A48_06221 [Cryoendolithus antarcticus]|uniref:Alpha/beta hydrolase fold-3 domain-containing protein n=1 Tax=Cryoendolithus antarcticus TaxID=1507870 RepID=A0A1V8TAS7_9PEZI|nr:hypothetical protein B0A48_06221 [Cryoendolithus antarcticus]
MASKDYKPPGRLGDPDACPANDPRANPSMVKQLKAFGIDGRQHMDHPGTDIKVVTPLIKAFHDGTMGLYEAMENDRPSDASDAEVTITEKTIKGVDNNDIKLYIHRLASAKGPSPCVVYFHGGGMVINTTSNKVHDRWCKSLALQGVVVVMPDYRNAWSEGKYDPFPAGLNDCASATQYVHANKRELGISHLILHGESGGGNLSIATTLKAKRDGWLSSISGVYAVVPYISNGYGWSDAEKLAALPSLIENDGYWLSVNTMAALGHYYGPKDVRNPHAWPYHSKIKDLEGLPPFELAMDELDPLRDEGMAFHRMLLKAGVTSKAHVNLGCVHGSSLIFRKAMPELNETAVRSIVSFAKSVAPSLEVEIGGLKL